MVSAIKVHVLPKVDAGNRDQLREKLPPSRVRSSTKRMPTAAMFNQGGTPTIALVNAATVPLGVDLYALARALQIYVDQHYAPVWGTACKVVAVTGNQIPANCWGIVFLDNADQAGALGYHDLTPTGLPMSKVFVKTIQHYNESLSVTASHELAEMLVDPGIQMAVYGPNGLFYAYETADACEAYGFKINGIIMSDFVYPSWFESFHPANSVKFDHLNKCSRPFQLLPGGYIGVFGRQGWTQIFGDKNQALAKRQFKRAPELHARAHFRGEFHPHDNPHKRSSKAVLGAPK